MVQHLAHGVKHILDIAGLMEQAIWSNIHYEHAGMLSLDGGIKVIGNSIVTLSIDGDIKVLLCKGCRFRSHKTIKFTMTKCGSRSSQGSTVHYVVLQ
jgi:hypothetical protein